MKRVHKYLLSGYVVILFTVLVGIFRTGKSSKQLDVLSGKLRTQQTCFGGFPFYTSRSKENALSSAARTNAESVDWLTIDSDSYYIGNTCGRRDYRTLFSVFNAVDLQVVDPNVRQEFARLVLKELKENRSVSFTTRHLLKFVEELQIRRTKESPEAVLIDVWKSTTASPQAPVQPPETKRKQQVVLPNGR